MRHVEVNGVRLSAIGLGCWQFGSSDWGYGKEYGDTTAVDIVHRALDLGVNLIDTAEIYARGVSETIVGRAIDGRRDEAFVATKLSPVWPDAPPGRTSTAGCRRCASASTPSTSTRCTCPTRSCRRRRRWRGCAACRTTGSCATSG